MKLWKNILILAVALVAGRAQEGRSVVVLYNSKMPASKSLAEYYAEKRAVPSEQVIGLPLPEKEIITRDEYRNDLVEPFLHKLEALKLMTFSTRKWTNAGGKVQESPLVDHSSIRYAALCFGVPVKIEQDNRIQEPNPENSPAIAIRNEAAVDSELALLPMHYAKLSLNGPIANRWYGTTNLFSLDPTNGIFMVARLDGPTPEIARGLIDKALEAEKEGLWGRAYFDLRGLTSGEYKVGDEMLRAAENNVARIGFEIIEDKQEAVFGPGFPMPQIAIYAGWYQYNVSGALARPTVEFMPGAFAYHLHSFSAEIVRTATERWVGPLLAKGATCTMGAVYEPFLQGTPDLAAFFVSWIYKQGTFGEAAYVAQKMLSWQVTVIGDPLYAPFAKKPWQVHEELQKEHSKLLDWSLLRVANINLVTALPPEQVIDFLEKRPEIKTSALINEKLGDLLKSKGKWMEAIEPYERALKLNPTPQQKLRILLTLGVMNTNLDQGQKAYEAYHEIIHDYPDYPDLSRIYQKILPFADQFGKPGEAAEYNRALKELTPKT